MYGFWGCGASRSEIWSDVTMAGQTNNQPTNKERQGYSANGLWKAEMSNKYVDIADFQKYLIQRQSTGLGLTQTISPYFCLSLILGQVWIRLGSRIKGFSSLHFQKDILINLSKNLVFSNLDSKQEHFQFLQNQSIIKNSENQRIFK